MSLDYDSIYTINRVGAYIIYVLASLTATSALIYTAYKKPSCASKDLSNNRKNSLEELVESETRKT